MLKSQKYSGLVFDNVKSIANVDANVAKRYKSLCKRAGGIFRTVGLVHFVTFIEAKGKKEPNYEVLSHHLQSEINEIQLLKSTDANDYLKKIRELNLPKFMQVSQTVLQLLQWHKRMSEILIEGIED